ncbi:hypothetical protein B0H19DRAFT_300685 [Mycena capillaripes]|nr:hypothetical protein B0H19DRAFT_300685 [Mycena capillaripes]
MGKGHSHKKRQAQRKIQRAKLDKQYELRSAASHIHASAFMACRELLLYHLLEACTLSTLIALSHTSTLFRALVKSLYRIRLTSLVESFVGHENAKRFFEVLQSTESALTGSTVSRILAPPINDVEEWFPNNLNIYPPLGQITPWEDFFNRIGLPPCVNQPGVSLRYGTVTNSHREYESRMLDRRIMLSESINSCVITPATASATTMGMCIATCSTIAVLYPQLFDKRRAIEGWNGTTVSTCIKMQDRGFKRSLSTMAWSKSCGWNCPAVWRRLQGSFAGAVSMVI